MNPPRTPGQVEPEPQRPRGWRIVVPDATDPSPMPVIGAILLLLAACAAICSAIVYIADGWTAAVARAFHVISLLTVPGLLMSVRVERIELVQSCAKCEREQ